jgi:leucyl-tRNA synthetase
MPPSTYLIPYIIPPLLIYLYQDSKVMKNSFLHEHLSQSNIPERDEELIKWTAISMYLGGADTVWLNLSFFLLI